MKLTGPPCKKCGSTEKQSSGRCAPCARERANAHRAANPESVREATREAVRRHRRRKSSRPSDQPLAILARLEEEYGSRSTAAGVRRLRELASEFILPFTRPKPGGLVDLLLWAADEIERRALADTSDPTPPGTDRERGGG